MRPLAHGHSVGIYFAYIALIGGVSDGGGAAERRRPPWSRGVGMVFYAVLVSEKLSVGSARRNVIVCRGLPSGRFGCSRLSARLASIRSI